MPFATHESASCTLNDLLSTLSSRIHRSAEECMEGEAKAGVADDVESEEVI